MAMRAFRLWRRPCPKINVAALAKFSPVMLRLIPGHRSAARLNKSEANRSARQGLFVPYKFQKLALIPIEYGAIVPCVSCCYLCAITTDARAR
jgi:hypothetical protein